MFEDSILESGGKGKKATTVIFSTIVHFGLLGVLILIPLIFTEQLEAAKYLVALTAPPPPPPPPPPPAAPTMQQKPVPVKVVQVDPGAIVAPTEIPKQIAHIVEEAPTGVVGGVV